MNVYLVSRTDHYSYDEYASFVCIAPSPLAARNMHPDDVNGEWQQDESANWVGKDNVGSLQVMFLGKASARFSIPEVIHTKYERG